MMTAIETTDLTSYTGESRLEFIDGFQVGEIIYEEPAGGAIMPYLMEAGRALQDGVYLGYHSARLKADLKKHIANLRGASHE